MTANPGQQMERLISLSAEAIALARRGNRTPEEIEKLIKNLQNFKDAPSAKPEWVYPGRSGNKCNRCGGCIDEGGICNCGIDHDRQVLLR
ncbi:hypothetical protein JW977_04390 [Candidatus Falkowbacteria bacterium]|nr:hypothetical protein [Candidatus Falkowbacteria bacterium]